MNITPSERVDRVLIGLAVIVAGAWLLSAFAGPVALALEVLLVLAGADLAVTWTLSLYRSLGYTPRSLRETLP